MKEDFHHIIAIPVISDNQFLTYLMNNHTIIYLHQTGITYSAYILKIIVQNEYSFTFISHLVSDENTILSCRHLMKQCIDRNFTEPSNSIILSDKIQSRSKKKVISQPLETFEPVVVM